MNTAFPFGFPPSTAFYLTLYVLTLVVHVVFMNYCLAGSLVLACNVGRREVGPLASILRDWMPFALSAAITAGVAPLLFVQILYKQQFYTANLLLLHRWMSILIVLMVGFYLTYLLKTPTLSRARPVFRVVVAAVVLACIGFTGFSWTENHMLSQQPQAVWVEHYAAGRTWFADVRLGPRFGVWFFGALPTLAVLLGWQLRHRDPESPSGRTLAWLALAGLLGAAVCAVIYVALMPPASRAALTSPLARPYSMIAAVGVAMQLYGWGVRLRRGRLEGGMLGLTLAGVTLTLLGMSVLRESLRLSAIDITMLYDQHVRAAEFGGLAIFVLFAMLNAVLIAACLRIVRRYALREPARDS